jgi:PAS domain S-box-containing protein
MMFKNKSVCFTAKTILSLITILIVNLTCIAGENDDVLIVKGDLNYPPYEYLNEKGKPEGFNVDIIRAVANEMNLNIKIELGPWHKVRADLENGKIDILQGMYRSNERDEKIDFSIPHLLNSYMIYKLEGSEIELVEDLKNKKIAVQKGDYADDYLNSKKFSPYLLQYETTTEALLAVKEGKADCAVLPSFQGETISLNKNLKGIVTARVPLIQMEYCFAVPEGREELIHVLNNGLMLIKQSGEYERIHKKWFGVMSAKEGAYKPYRQIVIPIAVLAFAVLLSLLIRNRLLTRKISRQNLKIKTEKDRLRITLNSIGDAVISTDIFGRIETMNSVAEELTGRKFADASGMLIEEVLTLTHDITNEPVVNPVDRVLAEGKSVALAQKTILTSKEGLRYNIADTASPIFNEAGRLSGAVMVFRDISEEYKLKEELARKEATYREIFENSNDAIVILQNNVIVNCNRRTLELFGYPKNEIIGKDPALLSPEVQPNGEKSIYSANDKLTAALAGDMKIFEWQHNTSSDDLFYAEVKLSRFFVNDDTYVMGVIRNITEQKENREKLIESEERLRLFFEKAPIGIIHLSKSGTIEEVNRQAQEIFGYTREDMIGLKTAELSNDKFKEAVLSCLSGKESTYRDYYFAETDKKTSYIVASMLPIFKDDEVVSGVIIVEDFIDIKEAEEQLQEVTENLKTVIESTADGILAVSNDGSIRHYNKQFVEIWGLEDLIENAENESELLKYVDSKIESPVNFLSMVAALNASDDKDFGEIKLNSGKIFESYTAPLIRDGKNFGRVWSFRDITKIRADEFAIRENEKRLNDAIEGTQDGLWDLDLRTNEAFLSDRYDTMLGYEVGELPRSGEAWSGLVHPDDIDAALQRLNDYIEGKTDIYESEFRMRTKDGSYRWIAGRGKAIRDENGKAFRMRGFNTDITEAKLAQEELKNSEIRYRTIFDSAPVGIVHFDKEGTIVDLNRAFVEIMGTKKERLLGFNMIKGLQNQKAVDCIKDVVEGKEAYFDDTYAAVTGTKTINLQAFFATLYDAEGNITGGIGLYRDVTQEKATALALQKSEEMHRKLLMTVPDIIIRTDLEGTITFVNENAFQYSRFVPNVELTGKKMLSFIEERDLPKAIEYTRLMFEKPLGPQEYRLKFDEEIVDVEVNGDVMYDAGNNPVGMVYVIRDVTEQKKSEIALAESEENLRTTLDSIGDGVITTDKDGKIIRMNPQAQKLTGYFLEEALGKELEDVFNIIHTKTRKPADNPVKKVLETGMTVGLANHTSLISRDGTEFHIADSAAPIINNEGEIYGVVLVFRDVSEEYKIREEIKEREEEFRKMLGAVPDMISIQDLDMNILYSNWNGFGEVPERRRLLSTKCHKTYRNCDEICQDCEAVKVFDTKETVAVERELPDGSWVDLRVIPLFDKNGAMTSFVEWVRDITDRKQFEKQLKEQTNRLDSIFSAADSVGFVMTDLKGNILEFSPGAEKSLGYKKEEMRGKPARMVLTEDHIKRLPEKMEYAVRERKGQTEECMLIRKSGEQFPAIFTFHPVTDADDQVVSFLGVAIDITARKETENRLLENQSRMGTLLSNLPGMAYRCLNIADWPMSYVSDGVLKLTGYTPEEITNSGGGIDYGHLVHNADVKRVDDSIQTALSKGEAFTIEYRILTKQGELKWVWERGRAVGRNEKGFTVLEGFITDITPSKLADIAVSESQKRLSLFIEQSPLAIIQWNPDFTIAEWNPAAERVFGFSKDEAVGKRGTDTILQGAIYESVLPVWNKLMTMKGGEYNINENSTKSGEPVICEWYNMPLENSDGIVIGISSIANDITERQMARRALEESEEKFRKFGQAALDAVIMIDDRGLIEYWNPAAERIFGYSFEDVIGQPVHDLLMPEYYRQRHESAWLRFAETGEGNVLGKMVELRAKNSAGEEFPIEIALSGITVKGRNGAIGYIRDISERKEAEKEINLKNEEYKIVNEELSATLSRIRYINHELQEAKSRAEESDNLKTAFLANLSHEIRTPMNGIMGFAQLLQSKQLETEKQNKYLGIIEKSGKRMLNLINDLVDISKLEAGQVKVYADSFDLNQVMDDTFHFFRPEAKDKGLVLNLKLGLKDEAAMILTDQPKFEQVLVNLLKNALKFTKSGEINFGYDLKGKFIEFWVEDTGPGIPEDYHTKIFERFRQADEVPYREEEGSGLGLAISKAFIELMGGRIYLESELGKGSKFIFTLPYRHEEKTGVIENAETNIDDFDLSKAVVMIAEDDEISYNYFKELMIDTKMTILRAANGMQAIDMFKEHPEINLILMDIKMPGINGLDAVRLIKEINPNVPVVAQTAYALESDKIKALAAGCDDYLSKPIAKDKLLDILRKFL